MIYFFFFGEKYIFYHSGTSLGGYSSWLCILFMNFEISEKSLEISEQSLEISKESLEISKESLEISKQSLEMLIY